MREDKSPAAPKPAAPRRASARAGLLARIPKTLRFGGIGALGCLLGALLGELLLNATRTLPQPVTRREVCLLIDCSGSMKGNKLEEVQRVASDFVRRQDLELGGIAVVNFSTAAQVAAPLTNNARLLMQAIAGFKAEGSTRMDLGLTTSMQQLPARAAAPQMVHRPGSARADGAPTVTTSRAILLFTDGQPDPTATSATLLAAQDARRAGIRLVCVGTGDADVRYLGQLAGDQEQVFAASDGRFADAFQRAEQIIYGKQLVELSPGASEYAPGFAVARIAGWTALLSLGVGLALILGQNAYLRRRLFRPKEDTLGVLGSVFAGLVAGALGQMLFAVAAHFPAFETAGRVLAWAILGGLIGWGMTFYVPNLRPLRAVLGGAVGGALGSAGFFVLGAAFGDLAGRLTGGALLGFSIGLMIVVVEQLAREACLLVHWGPHETTTVSLGEQPVVLGSSPEAHIYLPREKGFPPVTGLCSFTGGKVEFANKLTGKTHTLQNGNKLQLGTLMVEVQTAK